MGGRNWDSHARDSKTLEGGHGQAPSPRTLRGEAVPGGVHRIGLHINQCDGCYDRLTEPIGQALALHR